MKIVFVSNYYNHHQHPLCQTLDALNPGQFHFIATSEMRQERRNLGYGGWDIPCYVRTAHTGEADRLACQRLIEEADVVIAGATPEKLLAPRIRAGRLTFRYTERLFKQKPSKVELLKKRIAQRMRNPRRKPVYLLCAGAYTASDYARLGLFRDRAYCWGYFPETKIYALNQLMQNKNRKTILWVGRFLDWKHPEYALETAKRLRDAGYDFTLDMIGTGPMEQELRKLIAAQNLERHVHLLGAMKPEQVRSHMERAGIFLFTSDRQEGWGAVLNESLNSGCAVVASHAIGSVPYLIEDGKNGVIYRSGDLDMLFERVQFLLENPQEQEKLGKAAYETVTALWNADMAAKRLCVLAEHILSGEKPSQIYESGPCSRAEILSNDWM